MDYKKKTDEELVNATLNMSAGPIIEMMRRLKNSERGGRGQAPLIEI